ncbi:MAG: PEGA domain-containing protein [Myxococcales bacterium]|nr:PEGA domain-containing protein [Myxococcales bacterium]MCB9736580.1 PEGA domain-containing protein [Deltaproteobacteria bacterium]
MRALLTSPARLSAATLAAALMAFAPQATVLAARPKAPEPKVEAPGGVTIFSTTNGALVEIDGEPKGTLPIKGPIVLSPGVHKIRVSLRGWTEYIDTFEVAAGDETELEIDLVPFAGIVKVNTKDPGATVKIDGKVEGVTPFDKDIAVGKKVVTVGRPGFYDESREVDIRAGEEYVLDFQLREMPTTSSDDGEFYEQWWFWTIIGVAGAGAATAIALSSSGESAPPSAAFTLQIP